ncbi:MAG: ribbon-helix-helix domain-containing protein [Halobacteriales archaeon]
MPSNRQSVPVSLPSELVAELDRLVEEGKFGSRSDALRYGARLVTHQEATKRLHGLTQRRASEQVEERLERKRASHN